MASRYQHSAGAVLLAAADAVVDRTAELMGGIRHRAARPAATIRPEADRVLSLPHWTTGPEGP
jgi:hypothetical protein